MGKDVIRAMLAQVERVIQENEEYNREYRAIHNREYPRAERFMKHLQDRRKSLLRRLEAEDKGA